MPGLPQRNAQFSNSYSSPCSSGSVSANGIWSKHREDVTFDQLQKFWSDLSPQKRQELLRIDKQTLLEHARKNLYCSRCNGLLLEGFSQIVMYGKSMQQDCATAGHLTNGRLAASMNKKDGRLSAMTSRSHDDTQDPSVHPWGGLAATRDGILTLLDCFLGAKSLKALQNVFDCARARERERELLYPDACGGGGRGWISLGMANYGRGHGTRETCALHTARLSCDTLVDFWSALGDETRKSLLRMKEEDFIERLMYRFDSKRFCRDCRRNVIREFKELKELKRMRREPRCTSWFCVADTAFEYEVSDDTVMADWHQIFNDTVGTYTHFEWAIGTGEGKYDILEFEDAGTSGSVQMDGLDLGGLSACYITLRAWKQDGRCTELSVKAHAMKGQPCVHRKLVVGDGYVTISKGESIRRFFEHAEEAEEEEDDDSVDKDGNDMDGEGSRPQKHAKSPELAREFLLDAATVIFKEQVEKAFREGTARQNAHSIFVCLALKLLEERVHVACKEIITYEKQSKLLEEEEKEKREEEERKERRRTKEREKKLRRKERSKGKEKDREMENVESNQALCVSKSFEEELSPGIHEEPNNTTSEDSTCETKDIAVARPFSPDIQDEQSSNGCMTLKSHSSEDDALQHMCSIDDDDLTASDRSSFFITEQSKSSRRKLRLKKDSQLDPASKLCDRQWCAAGNDSCVHHESEPRSYGGCMGTPIRSISGANKSIQSSFDSSNCRNCGPKVDEKFHSTVRSGRMIKTISKLESASDVSRPSHRSSKYNQGCHMPDRSGTPKSRSISGSILSSRENHTKKVWEPTDARKKYSKSNSNCDVASRLSSTSRVDELGLNKHNGEGIGHRQASNVFESSGERLYETYGDGHRDNNNGSRHSDLNMDKSCTNGFELGANASESIMNSTSSSDNCSSCLSEGDNGSSTSSTQNAESWSTSDSEDASPQSEGKETPTSVVNGFQRRRDVVSPVSVCGVGVKPAANMPMKNLHTAADNGRIPQQQHMIRQRQSQGTHLPVFSEPSRVAYYHQGPASWSAAPTNGAIQYPQTSHYLFTNPLGYGVAANQPSHFPVQYSPFQPLTTSIYNMGQVPVYQPANKPNNVISKNSDIAHSPVLNSQDAQEAASTREKEHTRRSSDVNNENNSFSLFHFSVPTSMSRGPTHPIYSDLSITKNETTKIEEYSLFASSNGTRFSFF